MRWLTAFLDTPSRDAEDFWQRVTGSTLSARRGPFATLLPPGGDAYLRIQVVGDGPPRAHFDLHVEDLKTETDRVRDLGASIDDASDDVVVARSPGGLTFCLVPWHGERTRPDPVGWGSHRSEVDQICLDLPEDVFEAEADFFAALTGLARRNEPGSEFDRLKRTDDHLPLQFLLQRTTGRAPGLHVDLATNDRPAEVARHLGLGATKIRETDEWTTLADPVGRHYCVTTRTVH